ncbi:MAG: eL32 family ribosomal protein [Nanoarchaeota archaeon]
MKQKFVRQNISRKRLNVRWRKPRGIHSKLRLNKAGHIKKPSPGFRNERKNRVSKITLIKNLKDLVNAKNEILLSSRLGLRKKIEVLKRAKELNLKVLNVKSPDEFIKNVIQAIEKKKHEKKNKLTEKKKSKEKSTKEAEKKPEPEKEQEKP